MSLEESGRLFEYLAVRILIVMVMIYALWKTPTLPSYHPHSFSHWFQALLLSAASWVILKEGFVRHDVHSVIAFSGIGLMALAIAPRVARRFLLGTILAASVIMTSVAMRTPLSATLDPTTSVSSFLTALTAVALTSERARINAAAEAEARAAYGVPAEFLRRIGTAGVHVDPAETSAVQAYGLTWNPVPVFQRYAAYTQRADQVNANVAAGPRGPRRILRERVPAIDGRNDLWDSPRYVLQLMCRYMQWSVSERWQLLERSRNRCANETLLGRVTVRAGEVVAVPQPRKDGSIVVARIRTQTSLLERAIGIALKPRHALTLMADGITYRVAEDPDTGPIVVRVPRTVGWATGFGGESSYRLLRASRPAAFEFSEIPIRSSG